jgi:hypothetical protein
MERVIVDIDAEGNVKVAGDGVRGAGCQALTRAIEEAIGQTTGDVKKAEYFQPATQTQGANAANAARNLR